jgi:hypothetical protein
MCLTSHLLAFLMYEHRVFVEVKSIAYGGRWGLKMVFRPAVLGRNENSIEIPCSCSNSCDFCHGLNNIAFSRPRAFR